MKHTFYYELVRYDPKTSDHPRIPCYWIFDRRRMASGPLATGPFDASTYDWSTDHAAELARGWIAKGGTVAEAARSGRR